jgi:hypothetical protein
MLFYPSLGPANGEVMAETLVQYKDHGVKELTDTTFEHLTQVSRYSKKRISWAPLTGVEDPLVFLSELFLSDLDPWYP